jgi:hypothetical protein
VSRYGLANQQQRSARAQGREAREGRRASGGFDGASEAEQGREEDVDDAVLALAAAAADRERVLERDEDREGEVGGRRKEGGLGRLRSWRRKE